MKLAEVLGVTLNVSILAIFYTAFGGIISFGLKTLFYEFDETWKRSRLLFKIGEVGLELIFIGIIAYWSMFYIRKAPPIFPVSKTFDESVDTYISGIFFVYAIFLFFDHLSDKIQYLYKDSIKVLMRKMDGKQTNDTIHQNGV